MKAADMEKAFEEIEAYAEKVDTMCTDSTDPNDRMIEQGILLIARVLALGLKQIAVEVKDKL